jgi:16S rRNA (cytosine1402-N4)-methyltransferase
MPAMFRDDEAHAHAPRRDPAPPHGHAPVLLHEAVALLQPGPGRRFLDATFGGGGHTGALLSAGAQVTAVDCDPQAAARATLLCRAHPGRLQFLDTRFDELGGATGPYDGALFDLGVSSFQLDEAARGFSFLRDGPADMRLDPRRGVPASTFLETAPRADIERAVRDWGEERAWRRVTEAILAARGSGRLQRTSTLAELVAGAIPAALRHASRIHPATRTFQGLRIAVNAELDVIAAALPLAFSLLRPGGVLAVISFHSLEDRIVKRLFRRLCGQPESEDDARPADVRLATAVAEPITRRPQVPGDAETASNPRARSDHVTRRHTLPPPRRLARRRPRPARRRARPGHRLGAPPGGRHRLRHPPARERHPAHGTGHA